MDITKCIHNANDKGNDLCVILVEWVTQFMQIYFELNSYFGGILHYLNGVKYIVNVMTSGDRFETLLCLLHEPQIHYHQRMLLSINTNVCVYILNVLSLAVYCINNCVKMVLNLMDVLLSLPKQVKNPIKHFEIHMNNDRLNDYNKVPFSNYYHGIVILLDDILHSTHVISKIHKHYI